VERSYGLRGKRASAGDGQNKVFLYALVRAITAVAGQVHEGEQKGK
jgi:hypothetical protein